VQRVVEEVAAATKPVVLVAHSLGVATAIHAAPHLGNKIAGAFLVAPPDVANLEIRPKHLTTFGPYPREPLTFPSLVVASRNDPFGTYEHADDIAAAWGCVAARCRRSRAYQHGIRPPAPGRRARWSSPSS
jgi:predicted alpha/beta hydrolase family esterase